MNRTYREIIRARCQSLEPIPTQVEPRLRPIGPIRAVLFDIYGTLLISASGDVGTATESGRAEAFREALAAVDVPMQGDPRQAAECLIQAVHDAHQQARAQGVEFPEVDILRVWKATLDRLVALHVVPLEAKQVDLASLALQYETRVNPTWPMPGLTACLQQLRDWQMPLGIISNAQFFTPHLFPALVGRSLEELGFDPSLQFYSYRLGCAKPGRVLYDRAVEVLRKRGVPARNVLYIGNDMLNDVMAARQAGFHAALFAGDQRSLRLREDDPRTKKVLPDLVVTRLTQVVDCICPPGSGGD